MWASSVLAIIKAIPALTKFFHEVMDLYHKELDRQLESDMSEINATREKLVADLANAQSDEERSRLRRKLYDLQKK